MANNNEEEEYVELSELPRQKVLHEAGKGYKKYKREEAVKKIKHVGSVFGGFARQGKTALFGKTVRIKKNGKIVKKRVKGAFGRLAAQAQRGKKGKKIYRRERDNEYGGYFGEQLKGFERGDYFGEQLKTYGRKKGRGKYGIFG